MTRIWAKREKQLQRMESGMLNVVGDLQGIGQGAVGQLGRLLPCRLRQILRCSSVESGASRYSDVTILMNASIRYPATGPSNEDRTED